MWRTRRTPSRILIFASLAAAMAMRIVPLPQDWALWNPDWILLVLIYWAVMAPDRVGVGTAWLTGLLADALTGRLLGQDALAYSVVIYVGVRFHRRFRVYSMVQQVLAVVLLLGLGLLLTLWTRHIRGLASAPEGYWFAALSGGLVWPWVRVALDGLRRRYGAA
ncbi:rod shape-determining protein MreD [Methylococcus capsulatus]|uniref:Rod shape-determining protein MreD n=1 Tax=Methylococcus capsulatus (strain ATCC 33009 / NCIMB 11132 / Bath) TaxID=243233 RepID=Q60CK4_METCA|nr:rod shape-determining protein MreD [Methylococcus capsulatus]AAU90711.1 rod shape-determining protein MreD [Methylococcus capsulatus str. Bath]QXP86399.1 rod shape-determining protein MreD [Methylococcus capsulatus]QXP89384.1 rod shape-determining protein MreD [Methylococcus capsulatus]QXP93932.1 rod shape-determining protein MreD [Methylococcus capsulatus]UQN11343.1 rod shape-determining protein MreD [Methylococcus capsulatus]